MGAAALTAPAADEPSWREVVRLLREGTDAEVAELLDLLATMESGEGLTELEVLPWRWEAWGREHQQMPDEVRWEILFLCCGRGGGKTRTGAELTISTLWHNDHGGYAALIAPTYSDIGGVMVEGESGILARSPPWFRPKWRPGGKWGGELHWPPSPGCQRGPSSLGGVIGYCFTAEKPEQIRGPQFGWFWGDEVRAWDEHGGNGLNVLSNIEFAHRLGPEANRRGVLTSTPKPTPLILELARRDEQDREELARGERDPERRTTILRRWSTSANAANLGAEFVAKLERRYGGSTKGREELEGEIITSDPLAAWSQELIDRYAIREQDVPELVRVIVAVDNASEDGDGDRDDSSVQSRNRAGGRADTGIVLLGEDVHGTVYVLDDLTVSCGPEQWGSIVCDCLDEPVWGDQRAAVAVIERNAGGAPMESMLRLVAEDRARIRAEDRRRAKAHGRPVPPPRYGRDTLPITFVRARDGKEARADPIVTLYEQGRVRHVRYDGEAPLADLEFQMTKFRRGAKAWKKDRVDALVWGATYLAVYEDLPEQPTAAERARAWSY